VSNWIVFKKCQIWQFSNVLIIFESQVWQFSSVKFVIFQKLSLRTSGPHLGPLHRILRIYWRVAPPTKIFFLTLPNRPLAFDASIFRRIIQEASAFFYARSSNIHLDHDKSFTTRIVIMIFSLRKIFYGLVASADNYFCPRTHADSGNPANFRLGPPRQLLN
jgi:hypothetical protein